ncbi:MAG: glutamate 5-kinase [Desulfovibrionales bacterium]|nr:glutamate 5-kinase [Desulfovibrionales bacterium]
MPMENHDAQRREIIRNTKRVVIKVGSAVLTSEQGVDLRVISRLADQIACLHDKGLAVVLVSSGAVASGKARLIEQRLDVNGFPEYQALSALGQSRLMREYDDAFRRFGKLTAQILLTRDDFKHRSRFLNALNTMRQLLDWSVIPIVNENDTVCFQHLHFGDNDYLASLMVSLVNADLFINLTSARGVCDVNPLQDPNAKVLPVIEDIASLDIDNLCKGKTSAGSGGMHSKLMAARRAAQIGAATIIMAGREPHALERVFNGEALGTFIPAESKSVSQRKFWMAYHDTPEGALSLDAGAVRAVAERGKSLLPAGVNRVEGTFEVGALVRLLGPDGDTIGVGLTNYDSEDLAKILGRQTRDIESLLGACPYAEIVHRDNLLLDPAI